MIMRKFFQYVLMTVTAMMVTSCASDMDGALVKTDKSRTQFVVGDFPAFRDSQTRTVGTEDGGKTSWVDGDEILLSFTSKILGEQRATLTKTSSGWEIKDSPIYMREDEAPAVKALYAPNYEWKDNTLSLKDGTVEGTGEYIEVDCDVHSADEIIVPFNNATRNYSRLRIATIKNEPITVGTEYFTPVAGSREDSKEYSLTSDNNGNVFLYGSFVKNSTVTIKYNGTYLANHAFTGTTENGKSYALDATVISESSVDDIGGAIANKIAEGKTNINLILTSEADENVFENIQYGLMEASNGTINLTVMGCKKIPSSAFKHFTMLKSITLPDVEEIGEYAFANCTRLQKVVLGNLKKVYGNKDSGGIFDGCAPKHYIDLVLSNDQKVMRGKEIEDGRYCWTPDMENYNNSMYHKSQKFLDYDFKSIKCGYQTYP